MHPWLEKKVKQGFEPNTEAPLGTPDNPSSKIFTMANAITLMRMALTAIFLWMFIDGANRYISVAIYALAACTDWMDGRLARKTQTVSWFGKLLDPICDRFLLFCGVVGLVVRQELPLWVAIFVIGRDVYLAIGALILQRYRKRPVDVVYIGKITTALLMFGFCDMLLGLPVLNGFNVTAIPWLPLLNSQSAAVGILFIYVGCICSLITALVYTYEGVAIIRVSKERAERAATYADMRKNSDDASANQAAATTTDEASAAAGGSQEPSSSDSEPISQTTTQAPEENA